MVSAISLTMQINLLLFVNATFLLWIVSLEIIAMGIIVKSLGSDLPSTPRLL